MDINQIKENKLKTILRFSIPSIIAMLLETVITITDGYWNHIWNVYPRGWKTCLKGVPGDLKQRRIKALQKLVQQSSFSHGISLDELEELEKLITVEYLNSFMVVYERKKGNYHNLPEEWCKFIKKYEYLSSEDTLYIECTIDDPSITDEDRCMYELCQTISPILFMVYQEMFCRWLSKTGNQLDDYLDRSGSVRRMSGCLIFIIKTNQKTIVKNYDCFFVHLCT